MGLWTRLRPDLERVAVQLNLFGRVEEEEHFYEFSGDLIVTGRQQIRVTAVSR